MTDQEKTRVQQSISRGKLQEAIKQLLALELSDSMRKEVLSISSRHSELRKKIRSGGLSFEQQSAAESQIINDLISLIEHPEELMPLVHSQNPVTAHPAGRIFLFVVGGILSVVIGMWAIWQLLPQPSTPDEPLQLTVFVTDAKGNVILENTGRLNIPLGNRSLNEPIGTNGRTNFGDITADSYGDTIRIGMEAPGWEIANGQNTFVFTGEPIRLIVQAEEQLGLLKGIIQSEDEREFIANALIRINADTTVLSDSLGFFRVLLPSHMRIQRPGDTYTLTVSKEGYLPQTHTCKPNSNDVVIKLQKE